MDQNGSETSQHCMACNRVIFDAAKSCKCGHVNEAMRTIAGKRFSGYREELYTRRVIKESRDEYRRMKRESLGIRPRPRPRKSATPEKLQLRRKRKRLDDMSMCTITSDSHDQLNGELDYDNPTDNKPYANGNRGNHNTAHGQDITPDETLHVTTARDAISLRDDFKNDVYVDTSIAYRNECRSDDSYATQQIYKQYNGNTKTKTIHNKRGPKKTTFHHHMDRKTQELGCRENKTTTTRPVKQFAIAGPLAEINKRLMNQSGIWMCLGDSIGFGKPATTDIMLKDVLQPVRP